MSESIHRADSFDAHAKVPEVSKETGELFFISDAATTQDFPHDAAHGVFEFAATTRVNDALHALADRGFLSAPVWDEEKRAYLGFVDVFDLCSLVVGVDLIAHLLPASVFRKHQRIDEKPTTLASLFQDDGGADAFSKWDPVFEGAPFKDVVRILASGARRVPVVSRATGRVTQIISQSAVVAALYERFRAHPDKVLVDSPASTGIGIKPVFIVRDYDETRLAFLTMVDKRISAVGVVESATGELLTCISSKDIRMVPKLETALTSGRSVLDLPCREFVALVRRTTEKLGKSHAAIVTCEEHAPLCTVLGKLAATKMHRVFIVDKDNKPVGIVSVSDVLVALNEIQPQQRAAGSSASKASA